MLSFNTTDKYKPRPGQLCITFKGKDNIYPVTNSKNSLNSYPLFSNEIVLITKVIYHEDISSYYVEFMRDNRLFYTYFYEQVLCFTNDEAYDSIVKLEEPEVTFDYPWVICE